MNSFKIIQQNTHNENSYRVKLKESLLKSEVSKLKIICTNVKSILNMIKSLHKTFNQSRSKSEQEYLLQCTQLLMPLSKEIKKAYTNVHTENSSYFIEAQRKEIHKSIQQNFFMTLLRDYQQKKAELLSKIKVMENSLQYYRENHQLISQQPEQFDEILSSLPFLDDYIALQNQKQRVIQTIIDKALALKVQNAQVYCRTCLYNIDTDALCQNVLFKEKIISHSLKKNIPQLRRELEALKSKSSHFSRALKLANTQISHMTLEININSCNNFLLESDHYVRFWNLMKQSINKKLTSDLPTLQSLHKSKSCTVMQNSLSNDENQSLVFNSSISLQNQQSLLDNLDYFVSQNFLKDLNDHQF